MTLVKWTPKREMLNFFDDVDRMINQAFSHPLETEHESGFFSPFMNVNESDLEYTVSMDLPGVDKKDVEVNMSEGVITVTGMRKNSQQRKNNSCIWQENSHGTFRRSFELTNSVQENKIKARYKNGVLTLTIPKVEKVDPPVKNIAVS
jgi:HSP20 family protein